MKNVLLILITVFLWTSGYSQVEYDKAYTKLAEKLNNNSNIRFKDAVFMVENAFDERLIQNDYLSNISFLSGIIRVREASDSLIYKGSDKTKIEKYSAIFKTLTDTTRLLLAGKKYEILPIRYDFDDFFGEKSW